MRRPLAVFALVLAAASSLAVPRVLIGQYRSFDSEGVEITLRVAEELARELDAAGQVEPVVWSMFDNKFREIALAEHLTENLQTANPNNVAEVTRAVQAEYFLEIIAPKDAQGTRPIVKLYQNRNNRPVWEFGTIRGRNYEPSVLFDGRQDTARSRAVEEELMKSGQGLNSLQVFVNGVPDWDSLSMSLARTWARLLEETAFKALPRRPRIDLPTLNTGYLITAKGIEIDSATPEACLQKVDQYLAESRQDIAIVLLRDGIDKSPLHPGLRSKLSHLLMEMGLYNQAAEEAERAARLGQDQTDLWLTAARAWLLANKPDPAENALREALARGAQSAASDLLLGDVRLLQGDNALAIECYTRSIQAGPRPLAILGRAMAYALQGMAAECRADLASLVDADPEQYVEAYMQAIQLTDGKFDAVTAQIRDLAPALRLDRQNPANQTRANIAAQTCTALSELIDNLPVPQKFDKSHQARALAYKLLAQSASEILEYAQTGREELGDEGLISLGEALRLMPGIREAFRVERTETGDE